MMALMALSEMATRVGWQAVGLTVTVSNSSGLFHIFRLDTNNKLITQNVEVSKIHSRLSLMGHGHTFIGNLSG